MQAENNTVTVENYSEKAIVVRGEGTRKIKDNLMKIGGKFNSQLRDGAGWIFPCAENHRSAKGHYWD